MEDRRGTTLLQLLRELHETGCLTATPATRPAFMTDFTEEAPRPERFYGREQELRSVLDAVGQVPVLVVTGMPGIGKTTLGAKVCEVLRGKRSLFWRQIRPWDTDSYLAGRLASFLKAMGRVELHGYLAAPGHKEMSIVEDRLREDLADVEALLVFDDVQAASPEAQVFLSLLNGVLKAQRGVSALLLARSRPLTYNPRDTAEGKVKEVPLAGLDMVDCREFLLGVRVGTERLVRLHRISGGSPLFLKLLVGTAKRDIPDGDSLALRAYVAKEVDPTLSQAERSCLEVASFYSVPVAADGLLLERKGKAATLLALQAKGLLDSRPNETFVVHDFLRDYIQGGLTRSRRDSLAKKVAAWLIHDAEEVLERGKREDGIARLQNAVAIDPDRARQASSIHRIGDIRRDLGDVLGAMEAYRSAIKVSSDAEFRASNHEHLARCLDILGEFEKAEREIEKATATLPPGSPLGMAKILATKVMINFHSKREYGTALADLERALDLLASTTANAAPASRGFSLYGPTQLLRSQLRFFRGVVHLHNPDGFDLSRVEDDYLAAIEDVEALGLRPVVEYNALGTAYLLSGKCDEAHRAIWRSVAYADEIGDPPARAFPLFAKAWYLGHCAGDIEASEACYWDAIRMSRISHARIRLVWAYKLLADLYHLHCRPLEAREKLSYFLEMSEGILDSERKIENLCLMARLCVLTDDPRAAESHIDQAQRLASRGDVASRYQITWAKASLNAWRGEKAQALANFKRADRLPLVVVTRAYVHEDFAVPRHKGDFLVEFGRFLLSTGDADAATRVLQRARKQLRAHCQWHLMRETDRSLETLRSARQAADGAQGA